MFSYNKKSNKNLFMFFLFVLAGKSRVVSCVHAEQRKRLPKHGLSTHRAICGHAYHVLLLGCIFNVMCALSLAHCHHYMEGSLEKGLKGGNIIAWPYWPMRWYNKEKEDKKNR